MREKPIKKISNSEEQTKRFAEKIFKRLKGGEIFCLYGELGSGKTTFVKGLSLGLGLKERIISPTFILLRSYSPTRSRISRLHHIDLYRIHGPEDTEALGLEELLSEKNSVIVIEWAEKIKDLLPKRRIDIYFEYIDENKRLINIKRFS